MVAGESPDEQIREEEILAEAAAFEYRGQHALERGAAGRVAPVGWLGWRGVVVWWLRVATTLECVLFRRQLGVVEALTAAFRHGCGSARVLDAGAAVSTLLGDVAEPGLATRPP